jgi:hypothetical protein
MPLLPLTNSNHIISNALASLNNNYSNNYNAIVSSGNTISNSDNSYKLAPTFKMEMFKSENGGFIMNLYVLGAQGPKLFILNDIQNMGNDIQNILLAEILKS